MGLWRLGVRVASRLRREVRRATIARRLRAGVPLRPGPTWVQIGIEEHCNYRCGMCWAHSHLLPEHGRPHVLPTETFKHLVDQLSVVGAQRIDIGGSGEPLLHPDALDMLHYIKAAGIACVLITNGSLLDQAACDSLVEMRLDAINVSLNSATDDSHHRVADAPTGERSHIVAMLRYLAESRIRSGATRPCISVSFVVQKDNCREIIQIAQEAADLGYDNVEFAGLGINEASQELALSPREQREARRQMAEAQHLLDRAGIMNNVRHYLTVPQGPEWSKSVVAHTPCSVGQFFCRVLADGRVYPCGVSRRVVGDATRQQITDIWSSPAYRDFRREAFRLPARDSQLDGCGCYSCGHAHTILDYHRKLSVGLLPEVR